MAFGDQLNIVKGNNTSTSLTVTYSGGTAPSADDLNVLYAFTGATTISSMTAGFSEEAECLNTTDNDEGGIWSQVAADSGDDTCTMTVSASDENGMIMILVEGPFAASPVDLTDGHNGPAETVDPIVTGASGSSTDQADEFMAGICCSRKVDERPNDDFNRQGTATPTSAMTKVESQSMTNKKIYAGSQVLTGIGTVGISRTNGDSDPNMIGYATYKKASADQTVTPTPVVTTWFVATPTVTAGAVTVTPAAVVVTWVAPTPAVLNVNTVTPTAVATTWVVPTPTVTAGAVTVTPTAVVTTWSVTTPIVTSGSVVTPTAVGATWVVPTPTVTAGAVAVTPASVVTTWAVPTPAVTAGAVTVTPAAVVTTWFVASPTVANGNNVTPTSVVTTWAVPTPTVTAGAVTVTPAAVVTTWFVPTPTVTAPGTGIGRVIHAATVSGTAFHVATISGTAVSKATIGG